MGIQINMRESEKTIIVQRLSENLEKRGLRKTPERFTILRTMCDFQGLFSLEELGNSLESAEFRVSKATLYNNVKLFIQMRLLNSFRVLGNTRYEVIVNTTRHIRQICVSCGKVTEIKSPAIANTIDGLHLKRFRKDGFALSIYGMCSSCQARITREMNKNKNKKQKNGKRKS